MAIVRVELGREGKIGKSFCWRFRGVVGWWFCCERAMGAVLGVRAEEFGVDCAVDQCGNSYQRLWALDPR